jgi:Flp pilus assembly protein TadG
VSRARHYERGTTLPETAIVIGVLLLMVFGVIDFGRALYTYGFVADAARQGARWAMVRGVNSCIPSPHVDTCNASQSDIQTYVRSLSVGATNPGSITAIASWPGSGAGCTPSGGASGPKAPNCPVIVTVSYPFNFIMPHMPGSFTMSSRSQMVISQ